MALPVGRCGSQSARKPHGRCQRGLPSEGQVPVVAKASTDTAPGS